MQTAKKWVTDHRLASVIILVILILVGYWVYSRSAATDSAPEYVFGQVKRGNIVSTVSGTGQISAANQIELKSKVSGDITKLYVNTGDTVKAGDPILDIDSHDALIALQNARISYQKLTKPTDQVSLLQSENSLASSKQSAKEAADSLVKYYDDGFTDMVSAFTDLPDIMSGLNDMLFSSDGFLNVGPGVSNRTRESVRTAISSYNIASTDYDKVFNTYKNTYRTSASSTLESVISSTYEMVKEIADAAKSAKDSVDYIRDAEKDDSSDAIAAQDDLNTWIGQINDHLVELLSITNGINNAKTNIAQSNSDVREKTESLAKLVAGADPLDIQSERLSLSEKEYAYKNYFIKAPFDGVVAKLSVRPVDSVSSGASFGTLVGSGMIATITLNEVDVLKVKTGQPARLTFDAIDGLTIPGIVAAVDQVGTVSQGVVSYTVTIAFDRNDDRIRSGMSSSATIVTDERNAVLTVPNSAIKSRGFGQNSYKYVEIKDENNSSTASTSLTQIKVETGLSNDTLTEVTSGLSEGDSIVVRTVAATTARTTTAPSIFGNIGARGAGGGTGQRVNNTTR